MRQRYPAISLTAALTLLACIVIFAADRPGRVITPKGSPIWLDPLETLVFDAPLLAVMVRNDDSQPVKYALRLWAFGETGQPKGIQDSCTDIAMGGHTRGRIVVPITIAGVTLRDTIVVTVTAAASEYASWSLREDAPTQLDAALAASRGSAARLTLAREAGRPGEWSCSAGTVQ